MNERLTYMVIGSVLGAAAGYFTGAVIDEVITQRQAASHDLIDWEDREDYANVPEADDDDQDLDQDPISYKVTSVSKNQKGINVTNYAEYFGEIDRPDLTALIEKYNGNPDQLSVESNEKIEDRYEEEDWETVEDSVEEDADLGDPRIISVEDYSEDSVFAHVTLLYFDEDDVLTDSRRNPINRPEKLIGEDALVSFGEGSSDEDIVYVLNNEKGAMYEVVRQNDWFQPPLKSKMKKEERHEEEGDAL